MFHRSFFLKLTDLTLQRNVKSLLLNKIVGGLQRLMSFEGLSVNRFQIEIVQVKPLEIFRKFKDKRPLCLV